MAENKKKEQELYRLIYCIDGAPCFVQLVPKGARLTGLFRPSMPYSTFDGWGEVPARMPANDLTLDGHFTRDVYRVIFAAGVEQYGVAELPAGRELTPPPAPRRDGCEFVEWKDFDGIMPAENRRFEAVFRPITYTVTYVIDDTYRFRVQCPFGEKFPRLAPPRRANYTFSGWSEMPETMPAGDVTIVGSFEEKRYKLTRTVDGVIFSEEYLPFGAEIDKKVKPVQEGYYFSGWRKLPDTMPARDVEVVASMYPARFRVDFLLNGETFHYIYVPFGEAIPPAVVPESHGKLFGGWDDLPETMPAHDVVVHGTLSDILYSLSFVIDGEEIDRRDVAEGAALPTDVVPPSKPGYAFVGWEEAPEEMPGHDLTLRGVYAAVRAKYVFMIDGEIYSEITPAEGESVSLPTPPDKDGKPFCGWEEPEQDPRTGVTTYRGSYIASAIYTITYMVEGEELGQQTLREGALPTPPVVEENDTYTFLGWDGLPETMPAENITVIGKTKRLKYNLTFEVGGETVYEMAMAAGQEISCPALAPREGFTFGGWQNVPAIMPEADLVIRGSYQIRTHTITYVMDGRTIFTAALPYGAPLVAPDVSAEETEERTFVGWFPEVSVMPDHDLVIEGAYSDTVCLIDVYVDGILTDTVRARVGEPPVLPIYPLRDGTHFVWQDVPSVVPQGRIEVHGGYVTNMYTITYLLGEVVIGEERYAYGETIDPRVEKPDAGTGAFLGWSNLPETMPDKNISVQATFADRTCHLTFRLDGRVYQEMDVPVGAPTPNPEVPAREGYQFDGWRNYVAVMPPYNFTAYGTYSRRTYHVTYLYGDEVIEEQDYAEGSPIIAPAAPEREHCTFRCWEGLGTHMPAEDLTVSARYSGESYRISFVVDGALLHTTDLEFGELVEPLTPEPQEGKEFGGWRNLPAFMPAREVIVTGSFVTKEYKVTYKVGEMTYRIDTYEVGDPITPPVPPERDHETFVRWANLASVMPDYDFTCTAEYSEVIRHYSFVLDGAVVKEGQCRKGEMLEPPEAPHRSGFAFAGWEGFTGVMPGEDVVYIGSYATDKFKVQYYLDGEFYCESGFDAGERVVPVDAPEVEGFTFGGWKGLPNVMPSDDVVVNGQMKPLMYRLTYRTDSKTVVFDQEVACGTKLGSVAAPALFGFEFCGWSDEPEVMPAHPLTVNGTYRFTGDNFLTSSLPDLMHIYERASVQKAPPKEPRAIVFVIGELVRVVVEGICYPIPTPSGKVCLRNSRVLDEEVLARAMRRVWKKYRLPRKVDLVICENDDTDRFKEFEASAGMPNDETIATYYEDAESFGAADYHTLRLSSAEGKIRVLITRTHAPTREAMERVLKKSGVSITNVNTPTGALGAYLQFNKRMERKRNQLCFFYLPNGVIGALLLDGQLVCMVQNRYPFNTRDWDVKERTEQVVDLLIAEAHRNLAMTPLSLIAVGGIDRTHARKCEKVIARMVKASVERRNRDSVGGLFGGTKRWKKPTVVQLGYARTENRTK